MKTEKNILIAFILNLSFSVFEFIGGIFTGSVAIMSDAVHDVGDAASIGISYILERKSKKKPDEDFSYGYGRYSVLGGLITTVILLAGSIIMIYNADNRLIAPTEINRNGMIIFAAVGVCVNFCAAYFTREGDSLNQKAVNLHMLEDVLGWAVVLVGAIIMRFTDLMIIDPIMCICVSLYILTNAIGNLKEVKDLFLVRVPNDIKIREIKEHLKEIDGIIDIHHVHVWSFSEHSHLATMHIVTDSEPTSIKESIREELNSHGIEHVTIEIENSSESCNEKCCTINAGSHTAHGHHHHHGHHSH